MGVFFASAPLLPSTVATSSNGNLFQNWGTSLVTYGAKKHTKKDSRRSSRDPAVQIGGCQYENLAREEGRVRGLTESLGSPGVHTALWQTLFRGSGLHFPNVKLQEKLQLHQLRSGISDIFFYAS